MLEKTLQEFSRFRIIPEVIEQISVQRGGVAHKNNVLAALSKCEKEFLLFCEDDLQVSAFFPQALKTALEENRQVVTFYVSANKAFYPSAIRGYLNGHYPKPDEGLYKVCNRKSFFGSQCLLLRSDAIEKIVSGWDDEEYFDNRLGKIIKDFWLYFPNPIQHAGGKLKSTWSPHGQPHQSITFDLWSKYGNI